MATSLAQFWLAIAAVIAVSWAIGELRTSLRPGWRAIPATLRKLGLVVVMSLLWPLLIVVALYHAGKAIWQQVRG